MQVVQIAVVSRGDYADREVEHDTNRCAVRELYAQQVVVASRTRLNHPTGHAAAADAKGMVDRGDPAGRDR